MSKKKNVLFLFSDQQRWDTMGCYGQELPVTPNLDALAGEGSKFNNAFTVQPVCGPARACLQTGKYATEIGCYRNGIELPQDEKTLANWMTEAGYETAYVGKWHLATTKGVNDFRTDPVPLERRGGYKDYWMASDVLEFTSHGYGGYVYDKDNEKVPFEGYRVDAMTDLALDFLDQRDEDKPFFMFVSYIEPHHQNDRGHYEGPEGSKEKFSDFVVPKDLAAISGDWSEEYPDYLGCCNSIDTNVGRLVQKLDDLGIREDTVIIYTSDHGSHFKTRNLDIPPQCDDYKRACHEGVIHVPLIINGPGFNNGQSHDELVTLLDLPPTILSVAGLEVPSYMAGRTVEEAVDPKVLDWPEEVFIQISESRVGRALRTDRWKYSVRDFDKDGITASCSDVYSEEFLYDLLKDPHEQNNLVHHDDYSHVRAELATLLKKHMVKAGEASPRIVSRQEQSL